MAVTHAQRGTKEDIQATARTLTWQAVAATSSVWASPRGKGILASTWAVPESQMFPNEGAVGGRVAQSKIKTMALGMDPKSGILIYPP